MELSKKMTDIHQELAFFIWTIPVGVAFIMGIDISIRKQHTVCDRLLSGNQFRPRV